MMMFNSSCYCYNTHGAEIYIIRNRSSGATLHGFLQDGHQDMSSRTEQSLMDASSLMNPSSNNLALQVQGHQEHQLLSSFGSDLLLSPTSPYGLQSSLLRSLMEPVAKPGLQQYDQYGQQMGQQASPATARFAPGAIREPLQFTNDAPFWNSSAAGFGVPAAAAVPDQASVRSPVKPSPPAPRAAAQLALKVGNTQKMQFFYLKTTENISARAS
jgi:hypothetical protein